MIEINLVPDIKQELIKAQRVRTGVISVAIFAGLAAIGVVVVLCIWVFVVQGTRGKLHDDTITAKSAEINKVSDLSEALTIQNQLKQLSVMHTSKNIDSRLFSVLDTINPPAPNDIQIVTASVDSSTKTITIEAQASAGFPALETFTKTIKATKVVISVDGTPETVPLADNLNDTERSYGEDAEGNRILRFVLSFTYPEGLFSAAAKSVIIEAPTKRNATDSFIGIPNGLFANKAPDVKETN